MSQTQARAGRLGEVGALFFVLGATALGGPAAHIAMMREQVVVRKGWLTEREFLDLLSATNLIPGPNSTEMAIHIGHQRAGWRGLLLAGFAFIVPAALITLGFAFALVHYGFRPEVQWLIFGVKPAVVAVVAHALFGLAPKALPNGRMVVLGAAALGALAFGVHELVVLFGAALVAMGVARRGAPTASGGIAAPLAVFAAAPATGAAVATVGGIFAVFAKIGSVLFGSGYVLLAFLRADLVERLGWLTEGQLLDAVAVGQITPGPVFTTATYVGYLLAGLPGAAAATVGIFLPAFVFVALSSPLLPRLRRSAAASAFLDGANAASLALMVLVTVQLGAAAIVDLISAALALGAGALLFATRLGATRVLLLSAALGAAVGYGRLHGAPW
jgi:chromate transporter